MVTGTVSTLSVICMGISMLLAFAIPIILLIRYRRKGADFLPFFIGCAVMLIFALILESLIHQLVLGSPAGETIRGNLWLYAVYGGLMAGLFEETGRFIAFKTVLKKKQDNDMNALMYGAGHGGFEVLAILGVTMLNNLIWSILINTGSLSLITSQVPANMMEQVNATFQALTETPPWQFLLGIVERCFAVIMQIALSVLVWFAAKKKGRGFLFPAAILLHAVVDGVTVILTGIGLSSLAVEGAVGAMAILLALLSKSVWNREHKDTEAMTET